MADFLRKQIVRGVYAPGARFPNRTTLAGSHQLAPMTVQRALEILQREGWLIARKGAPTTVADPLPLVAVHTQVIEGIGELFHDDSDGRRAVVEVVLDDDASSSTYVRLHSWSGSGNHPDLEQLVGQRLRVTVELLKPPGEAPDSPDAVVRVLPGMIDP